MEYRLHSTGRIMEKIRIEQHSFSGSLWFAGWLFTIGYLHLAFWKAVLAIVVWPYYIGVTLGSVAR
jgi:uncharacterized membrane protein